MTICNISNCYEDLLICEGIKFIQILIKKINDRIRNKLI